MKACDVCGSKDQVVWCSLDELGKGYGEPFGHPHLCEGCRTSVKLHLSELLTQHKYEGVTRAEINHLFNYGTHNE